MMEKTKVNPDTRIKDLTEEQAKAIYERDYWDKAACDAMPHGGRIVVRTENVFLCAEDSCSIHDARPGKFVRVSVTDTGTGMSKDVMQPQ